jgi:hypothetical protein
MIVPFPPTSWPIDLHIYAIIANGLQVSQLEAMYVDSSRWHLPSPITTRKIINWSSVDQNWIEQAPRAARCRAHLNGRHTEPGG